MTGGCANTVCCIYGLPLTTQGTSRCSEFEIRAMYVNTQIQILCRDDNILPPTATPTHQSDSLCISVYCRRVGGAITELKFKRTNSIFIELQSVLIQTPQHVSGANPWQASPYVTLMTMLCRFCGYARLKTVAPWKRKRD